MNTQEHPLTTVPPMNLGAIRDALKAHSVTLKDVEIQVDCTCDVCGASWSGSAPLEDRLHRSSWECYKCYAEDKAGGDDAHT
jgi:hypothetical protein